MSIKQLGAVSEETDKLKNEILNLNSNMQQTGRVLLDRVSYLVYPIGI